MGNMDQNWTPAEEALRVGDQSEEGFIAVDHDRWGAAFTADEIDSPDFGIAAEAKDDRLRGATYDPNTGYWMSNIVHLGDGSTRHEPWKPPYRWHREPIKRLRVEWARWKERHG